MIIPSRFRDVIQAGGEEALMMTSMDGALVAYPLSEWRNIENRIMALAEKSEAMRRFRRVFVGGAFECTYDKQGRVLVPPSLREQARLEKEIVLVGVLDHFEIWAQDKWEKEKQRMEIDMQNEEVRNEISRLGL